MSNIRIRNYADTFLYGKSDYEKKIYEFLMKSKEVDKTGPSFDNVKFEVKKRQTSSCISKLLDSPNIVLLKNEIQLPRAFKVFAGKDIKGGTDKLKVFIDITGLITEKAGVYDVDTRNVDQLISHLVSAMTALIYYAEPNRIVNNNGMLISGNRCFSTLFTHIVDYLRVGNVENIREKCLYISSIYYQVCLLGLDKTPNVYNKAMKVAGINRRNADIIDVQIEKDTFDNIENLIKTISKILKTDDLKIDNFIEKWIYLYGSGTQFAVELYPAFSNLLTNAYVGAYLNNQKAIEKIAGRDMVDFTNSLFKVGSELLK